MSFVQGIKGEWGENLRAQRELIGWTQEQLARELTARGTYCSQQSVNRWENGRVAPKDETKVALAELLRVDVRMLFPLRKVAS